MMRACSSLEHFFGKAGTRFRSFDNLCQSLLLPFNEMVKRKGEIPIRSGLPSHSLENVQTAWNREFGANDIFDTPPKT